MTVHQPRTRIQKKNRETILNAALEAQLNLCLIKVHVLDALNQFFLYRRHQYALLQISLHQQGAAPVGSHDSAGGLTRLVVDKRAYRHIALSGRYPQLAEAAYAAFVHREAHPNIDFII